jgi:hypothetical protein
MNLDVNSDDRDQGSDTEDHRRESSRLPRIMNLDVSSDDSSDDQGSDTEDQEQEVESDSGPESLLEDKDETEQDGAAAGELQATR